ncbi:peroxiredoxin [Acuticoccus kandeliae]|uniref:peroxiredoxin n=1 Tax=Acuticoccus kandeliae TaxID=2073160 RepID=UPI00196A7FC5|nr:peroxiredoxin [Acuticoccus kandeliae]
MLDTPSPHTPARAQIGAAAPRFQCRTTLGERSLDDFRGRWLVFFSHPADFTPVCTSEFLAFQAAFDAFQAIRCDLLGLSVDSLPSHLAWVKAIQDTFGTHITFPIAEDPSMAIARAYGMLGPDAADSSTVRATFIIDPDGIVRMSATYPMAIGRNVAELLRTVRALQTSDTHGVYTPEGWQPGGDVIAPALPTGPGPLDPDWFFKTRPLGAKA